MNSATCVQLHPQTSYHTIVEIVNCNTPTKRFTTICFEEQDKYILFDNIHVVVTNWLFM